MPTRADPVQQPSEFIQRIERAARHAKTPCGDGSMVWREWGREDGHAVVLLHGGFGSWLHWIRNIEALSARHRVLAADLPGLGDSALPREKDTPQGIAAPVSAGLGQLLADAEMVDLIGFSFGGLIAGQVAAALGPRVRSLTLVGASGLGLPREHVELIRRSPAMDAHALREAQAHNVRALMLHHPHSLDELALTIQAHNDACARIRSRPMSLGSGLRDVLPAVSARLNGIWGEHDVTAAPHLDARRELLASLHPELEFRVVDDAGHWVQYEASARFDSILASMLDR